ncbi:MAG TPA: DMT family transporter [Thermohalobaculum sp.]|nr:DMT family transporter [Thermohalobaculum sp.]
MSLGVFIAVLAAAALHATWNALVKGGVDKALGMTAVVLGSGLFALAALPLVATPAPESWPYVVASIALHLGYQLFLLMSYRIGDLTQVYPIARGTAPLIVAAFSVTVLGVELARLELAGVIVIGTGIISLSLVRRRDGLRNPRAAATAVVTGCFIAAYSLVDGTGARAAGTGVGFYGWVAAGNALAMLVFAALARPRLLRALPQAAGVAVAGGGASFAAYALVVWAFTQAPIALVTALRETSIVFALLIGVVFLKERLDLARVVSIMLTIGGAALLRLAR